MKIVTKPTNLAIEFTPKELGLLKKLVGVVAGQGPMQEFSNELYHILNNRGVITDDKTEFVNRPFTRGL